MTYGIIYKATNAINGKVYIGQTVMNFNDRVYQHIYKATKNNIKTVFAYAIRKYGEDNFKWEIIDSAKSRDDINNKEIYWINFYKSYIGFEDCNGYNMTKGGEGSSGFSQSDESKISKSGVNNRGAKMSIENIREMLSIANGGELTATELADMYSVHRSTIYAILSKKSYKRELSSIISDENLSNIQNKVMIRGELDRTEKISRGNKGKVISEEAINKRRESFKDGNYGKPVLQIDINSRNVIARYDSVRDGANTINCIETSISQCCRGEIQFSNGFIWVFEEDYDEYEVMNRDIKFVEKHVLQIDKNGNIVNSYESLADGAKAVNGDPSAISKCCRGRLKSHRGFKWVYEKDYILLEGVGIV